MKKMICALMALVLTGLLAGCSAGGTAKNELTLDQLAIRMALKELNEEDAEVYSGKISGMTEDNFDEFVALILKASDKDTDWELVQRNFAHLGAEMELPECASETESEFFVLRSFSIKPPDQTRRHLYFHLYSTWYESQGMGSDLITMSFDSEKLKFLSSYTSDEIAAVANSTADGEVSFHYEDRRATDPAPFDGDDRNGEVLVAIRVEPVADGEAAHSATLKHDGSKEIFEITVEDTVSLF